MSERMSTGLKTLWDPCNPGFENIENKENMENMEKMENINIMIQNTLFLTQNTLFVKQVTTQDNLFKAFIAKNHNIRAWRT